MTATYDAEFFKTTVFLPKTEFPMRGDLPQREPEALERWRTMDLYARLREKTGRRQWTLHDGPPYANGNIHIGHAVNKILKDVINRTMQMTGRDADYVPGWDCHGLPIEWKIEEKYRAEGRDKDSVPILEFRRECREFAQHWVDVQAVEFQRLGVVGNWKDPYLTMTKPAEAQIAREIHKFLMNGGLYKGVKPVLWSTVEKTALAEAEVEYHEHKSITIWVKFPVVKAAAPEIDGASVVIWTTTPWTMPSNRAIAAGADMDYAVYTVDAVADGARVKQGEKLVLNQKLAEDVREKSGIAAWTKGAEFKGAALAGTVCAHPLRGKGYEFDVPVLMGDFVTDDAGTGFVHIAPGHGADDFELGRANGIEIPDNVDDDGRFRASVPLFGGLAIFNAKGEFDQGNFAPLKAIDEVGNLLAKGSLRHDYPHSWRSKAPLIFRTTPQWFISMETNDLRAKALKAIGETKWYPPQGENRIRAMVESRPDWCISRQRAWGVPIAIFVDRATGNVLRDADVCKRIADIFESEGSDAWFARDPQDFLGEKYNAADYQQVRDIVDVWFESGSTHQFVLAPRGLPWPADLYLEGSDQHRGWFHSSLLESCGTVGRAPYNAVLTHGFVLDEKGMKMSKSTGNVVAPQSVMEKYGADILRLWTITTDYSEDVRIGDTVLKTTADMYRRIRNTYKYLLGALDGFTPDEAVDLNDLEKLPALERYMLHLLSTLDGDVRKAIADFDFGRMAHLVYGFCNGPLSAFYFDIRKDRLYCDRPDMFERRATRSVMAAMLESLCGWLAPVLSFTADEAWQYRPRGIFKNDADSVHLTDFVTLPESWRDPALAEKWDRVLAVRDVVLGAMEIARKDKMIGSALEAHPHIYINADSPDDIDWAEIVITSQTTLIRGAAPEGAFTLPGVPGVGVVVGRAEGKKCERSWKILPDVGMDVEFPTLTPRDADAVRAFLKKNRKAA
ncbi:MAG: isoleucine--tRNA ligase [Rhodospirillales bacterium]|nr:isoleucine--tRNA ligase [Rhodospirillales bacterium]USO07099.1 MAG: isoleucine--tRNA ligase [Rhodospirillales bacterium]